MQKTPKRQFDPWVGKIPWRREWRPTPVFLAGESHGQWSLVDYGSWGLKKSRTRLNNNLTAVSVLLSLGILYMPPTFSSFSSSFRVAHILSAKTPSQGHNLMYESEERERRNRTEAAADLEKPGGPRLSATAAARRRFQNFRSAFRIPYPGPPFPVTLT